MIILTFSKSLVFVAVLPLSLAVNYEIILNSQSDKHVKRTFLSHSYSESNDGYGTRCKLSLNSKWKLCKTSSFFHIFRSRLLHTLTMPVHSETIYGKYVSVCLLVFTAIVMKTNSISCKTVVFFSLRKYVNKIYPF